MKARWESCCAQPDDGNTTWEDGWAPFGVEPASWGFRVHLRRLVVAKCEDAHDADFDDKTCGFVLDDGEDGGAEWECGKPVIAVPVDPFDLIGVKR